MKLRHFFQNVAIACFYFFVYQVGQFATVYFCLIYLMIRTVIGEAQQPGFRPDPQALLAKCTEQLNQKTLTVSLLAGIVSLLLLWITFAARKRSLIKGAYIQKISGSSAAFSLMLGCSSYILLSYAIALFPFPEAWFESYLEQSSVLSGGNPWIQIIATVLIAPILEEIVFRGLIYTRLRRCMPKLLAAILTSALFGVMHGTIVWFFYTFLLALLMTFIFEKTESLLGNMLLHAAFNACGTAISLLPESAQTAIDSMPFFIHIGILAVGAAATLFGILHFLSDQQEDMEALMN